MITVTNNAVQRHFLLHSAMWQSLVIQSVLVVTQIGFYIKEGKREAWFVNWAAAMDGYLPVFIMTITVVPFRRVALVWDVLPYSIRPITFLVPLPPVVWNKQVYLLLKRNMFMTIWGD